MIQYSPKGTPFIQLDEHNRISFSVGTMSELGYMHLVFSSSRKEGHLSFLTNMRFEGVNKKRMKSFGFTKFLDSFKGILEKNIVDNILPLDKISFVNDEVSKLKLPKISPIMRAYTFRIVKPPKIGKARIIIKRKG